MNTRRILTAVAVAALAVLSGCTGPPSEPVFVIPPNAPDTGDVLAATAVTPPAFGGPAASFGEGTHRVIDDIQPGIYRTTGPVIADVPVCSWRLMKGDHIVASGAASSTVSIVVEPFYTDVQSTGCLQWVRER